MECLKCFVHKFTNKLNLSDFHFVYPCLDYRLLAIHFSDRSVNFLKIDAKRDFSESGLSHVKEFLWSDSKTGLLETDLSNQPSFCVLQEDGRISTHFIDQNTVQTQVGQPLSSVVGLLDKGFTAEHLNDVKFSSYDGTKLVICIKQCHLVALEVKKDNFKVLSVIDLPHSSSEKVQCYNVIRDVVVTFRSVSLSLYDVYSGNQFAQIDLKNSNIDSDRILSWHMSADLKSVVVIENTLATTWIDLESYVQKNPSTLWNTFIHDSTTSLSRNTVLHTGNIGDSVWRDRLFYLNDVHGKQIKPPWYQRWMSSRSDRDQRSNVNVSGFHRGSTKASSTKTDVEIKVYLPASLQNMTIQDAAVGRHSFSVVLTCDKEKVLSVCDFSTKICTTERFPTNSFVMLSRDSNFPHLAVMETHLLCVITNTSLQQQEFVSKVMLYAGASIADAVCHINKWGRCSIPLHALEVGLKHRQLDTVSFFLKSKENFFTSASNLAVASPTSPSISSPTWSFSSSHLDNLGQLEPALNLLLQTIKDNMTDSQSKQFSSKLADITLDFLYGLLHDGIGLSDSLKDKYGHENETADLKQALDKLLDIISDLRNCIRLLEDQNKKVGHVDEVDGNLVLNTDTPEEVQKNIEELIESSVKENRIPALQNQLQESGAGELASLEHIIESSLNRVIRHLSHKDIKPALIILSNLGMDVDEKLWDIALLSIDDQIRECIVSILMSRSSLQQHQQEIIDFAASIRKVYPCRSFTAAVTQSSSVETTRNKEALVFLPVKTSFKFDLTQECGDITNISQSSESEPGHYSEVLWEWLGALDSETKERILIDAEIQTEGVVELCKSRSVDAKVLLSYLLQHNNIEDLRKWIERLVENKDLSTLQLIVNNLDGSTSYVRDVIADLCARHGVIKDSHDFKSLLSNLRHARGPLVVPHPVARIHTEELDVFHGDFLHYCASNNLPTVLWQYCLQQKLSPQLLQSLVCDVYEDCKWMSMFVMFYSLVVHPNDVSVMYEASLANAAMTWSLESPSVSHLLSMGETLTALATLMYSPVDIPQVVPGVTRLQAIDNLAVGEVEKALLPYPKLHSALFPASTIDTPKNDVTVYDLMKDNAPFDPARLFGWQKMNRLAGEDCQKQLPHFSAPELVSKYGICEKIKYTYYLKQGRPSFAFASFLAEELDTDTTTISSTRLLQASSTALWIGVRNFHVSQVSCACVVFTEMLGQDSILLRTHLQVGQEILVHLNQGLTGSIDKRKEISKRHEEQIVNWLCGCILNRKKYGSFVLQKLENAISASIKQDRIQESSFDAGQKWLIAILFCRLLQLPLTTKFLEICAQSDKWLPFLWFAQIHQYTKEQLQTILYHFKSQHLQQHLHYVIENAENRAIADDVTKQRKKDTKAKDTRTALYSKIGVSKDESPADVSSSEDEANTQLTQTLSQQNTDVDDDDVMMIDIHSVPDDIFGVVFMAQKSKCPWKSLLHLSVTLCNPILAELAACFKDALVLPCLCGWLVAMMNSTEGDRVLKDHGKSISKWTIKHLGNIMDIYLQKDWGSTLATSFHIFQPNQLVLREVTRAEEHYFRFLTKCRTVTGAHGQWKTSVPGWRGTDTVQLQKDLKTSPLLHFLKFSAEIKERRNFSTCKLLLEDFKESMHQFCHGDKCNQELSIIGDTAWLQQTVYRILVHHFTHTSSLYDILQLLKLLECESIVLIFNFEVPDFGKLARMVQIIVDSATSDINFAAFISLDLTQYQNECLKVVNLMLDNNLFREARKFSKEAGLSADHATLKEIYYEKGKLESSSVWKSVVARKKFWSQCSSEFKQYTVSSDLIQTFYMDEVDKVDSDEEKAYLYDLCMHTLDADQLSDPQIVNTMYHQMWLYRIKDRLVKIQSHLTEDVTKEDDIFAVNDKTPQKTQGNRKELICFGKMPKPEDKPRDLSDEEIQALGMLVGELLDQGQISESCHLVAEFSYYSEDLAIILTCIRMSLGTVTISDMDTSMLKLMTPDPNRLKSVVSVGSSISLQRSTSGISLSSVMSSNLDFLPPEKEKIVITMDTLYGHCHHGNQCCKQIINCYLISCVLDMTYEDVVVSEEFDTLQALLKTNFQQRFKLASEYLSSSSLTSAQVAGFLSDSIVEACNVKFGNTESKDKDDLLFNPSQSVEVAEDFVKLCKDPSILGDRLLDAVASLSGDSREIPKSVLAVQTELLILSHLCYTAACNMEGISNVLRAARVVTFCIESTEEFPLMVRLLIGVGRFNEMTYIFDSLKQNEQFELLLKKGIEKENTLKIAILDYLKRFHPKDRDSYDMVSHYFMMHREIAETLEKRANQALAVFKKKPIDNSPETQSTMETVVQYLTDAAESYIKERCLRHAQACARQARLVALQVHYLQSEVKVIHLSLEEAEHFITTHPKFLEALIISETYGRRGCWAGALCNNVIMNGDFRYLQDFKLHIRLTPNLIADAVELYHLNPTKSSHGINNIKKFLTYCKDIRTQYKIAQDLDLRDVMTSLEKGDTGSYIQDIMSTRA